MPYRTNFASLVLVTDAIVAMGLSDGTYTLGEQGGRIEGRGGAGVKCINIAPQLEGHWKICRPRAAACRPRWEPNAKCARNCPISAVSFVTHYQNKISNTRNLGTPFSPPFMSSYPPSHPRLAMSCLCPAGDRGDRGPRAGGGDQHPLRGHRHAVEGHPEADQGRQVLHRRGPRGRYPPPRSGLSMGLVRAEYILTPGIENLPTYYIRFTTGKGDILPCVGCCLLPFRVTRVSSVFLQLSAM